jgi:hypothetical protein
VEFFEIFGGSEKRKKNRKKKKKRQKTVKRKKQSKNSSPLFSLVSTTYINPYILLIIEYLFV